MHCKHIHIPHLVRGLGWEEETGGGQDMSGAPMNGKPLPVILS